MQRKKHKKTKKNQSSQTPFHATPEQAVEFVRNYARLSGANVTAPLELATQGLSIINDALSGVMDVLIEGQNNVETDSIALTQSSAKLHELTEKFKLALGTAIPFADEFFDPAPSPAAKVAIDDLAKQLQLPIEVIKVVPGSAECEEQIKIPCHYMRTEALLVFLKRNQFAIVSLTTSDPDRAISHFLLSLSQYQQFNLIKQQWINFLLPICKVQHLITQRKDIANAVYTSGTLYLNNQDKDIQLVNGKNIPMLAVPLDEIGQQYVNMDMLFKLIDVLAKNKELIVYRLYINEISLLPVSCEIKLTSSPFEDKQIQGKHVPQLKFAEMHRLTTEMLDSFDNELQKINKTSLVLDAFLKKHKHALPYSIEFNIASNYFFFSPNARMSAVLLPLAGVLGAGLDSSSGKTFFTMEAMEKSLQEDLSDLLAEVCRREELFRKYEACRKQYGERYMPDMTYMNIATLTLEELCQHEAAIILEERVKIESAQTLSDNRNLITNIISTIIARGKCWNSVDDTLCIEKLATQGRAFLRLLNVPELVISEEGVTITLENLTKMDTLFLKSKVQEAAVLEAKLLQLDAIICKVRKKSSAERFTETGIRFEFCDEAHKLAFNNICTLLTPIPKNADGLYEIPLSICLRNDLDIVVLKKMNSAIDERFHAENKLVKEERQPEPPRRVQAVVEKKDKLKKAKTKIKPAKKSKPQQEHKASANPVVRTGTIVAAQPAERARELKPSANHISLLQAIAGMAVEQHDFMREEKKQAEQKVRLLNAHEGAILYELNMLESGSVWYQQCQSLVVQESVANKYSIAHLYSTELAMLRLMNAIDLRHELAPDSVQITIHDTDAKTIRAEIIHGLPTLACLMMISHKIRHDCQLKEVATDIFSGKVPRVAKSRLSDFMTLFKHVPFDPLTIITQTFTDLTDLLALEESEIRTRALEGCLVKLGELSQYTGRLFSAGNIIYGIKTFMRECHELRNVVSHNNVDSENFDPLPADIVLLTARKGCEIWSQNANITLANTNN